MPAARRFPPPSRSRRAGGGLFARRAATLEPRARGGITSDCGECRVFWCVPHKGSGRGYSRSYPACNRKPRRCLSPDEGRSFALPRHSELHRAAGLFRISERGSEGESRGSRKGEDRQCAITLGAGCPCNHAVSVAPGQPLCVDRDALAAILFAGVLASSPAETTTNGCQIIPGDAKVELLERYPNGLGFLRVIKVKVTSSALPDSTIGFTIETGR
jgi:hypothetical protein